MLQQIEGSQAIAEAVALCRPEVISCYPITPQTHIVEGLSAKVLKGEIPRCEFINVESEFAALSVLVGASATGARTYTATSSQGLLFMAEAVFNASGLGLPCVMTIGNRAVGAPINIWNDHSDSMALRDAGWIQLFAVNNQEAVDLHILAFKLAEQLSCPVMVCVDGFILTHAFERVDIPAQEQVDAYLPEYEPMQVLDPDDPMSIGAMVGPEAFTEVKYLAHHKHLQALDLIPELSAEFSRQFGRPLCGLVEPYRAADAETVVLALGSVNGTIRMAVDELRNTGLSIGALSICSYRPFPLSAVRSALEHVKRIVVVEKYLAPGLGGILASNVRMALRGLTVPVHTVVAGLGGRAITQRSIIDMLQSMATEGQDMDEPYFLDLNWDAVNNELEREKAKRRSGPIAENVLKDMNSVFSRIE